MQGEIIYLNLDQILVIHQDQIDRYGGNHGIRDLSLLESALFRPQTTFSGEDLYPTVFDKAAAIVHSLVLNHPFFDANKRTAIASAIIFLLLNGKEIIIGKDEMVNFVVGIAAQKYSIEQISAWLESKVTS